MRKTLAFLLALLLLSSPAVWASEVLPEEEPPAEAAPVEETLPAEPSEDEPAPAEEADEEEPAVEEPADLPEDVPEETAEVEEPIDPTETLWEMELTLPLTYADNWQEDLLAVAASQLGYEEREDGYTRYADWCRQYAAAYARAEDAELWSDIAVDDKWDAYFATFCLSYAGVKDFPVYPTAELWADKAGLADEEYIPVPGDLVFLDWDEANNPVLLDEDENPVLDEDDKEVLIPVPDHMGIVTSVQEERLWVIVGDSEDSVREVPVDAAFGFIALPEKPVELTEEPEPEPAVTEEAAAAVVQPEADVTPKLAPYALAPEGYVLLRVRDDLPEGQVYALDGTPMYYSTEPTFLLDPEDDGVFLLLADWDGEGTFSVVEGARSELVYDADVNEDGVLNIADANAIYQMIQNGGDYYSVDQITLEARLRLNYSYISDFAAIMDAINGV